MKRAIQILRLTAKALLVAAPLVLLTGYLTAKPAFVGPRYFATFRWLHSVAAPVVFVPLLLVHSLAGALFLLSRHKRWNRPWCRRGLMALWALFLALFAYLYVVDPTPRADAETAPPGATPDSSAMPADAASTEAAGSTASASSAGGAAGHRARTAALAAGGRGGHGAAPPAAGTRTARALPAVPTAPSTTARPSAAATTTARASASSSTTATTAAQLDGTKLIGQRCSGCHGVDQVYARGRSAAEWQGLIQRMIGHGATLSVDEQRAVLSRLPRR